MGVLVYIFMGPSFYIRFSFYMLVSRIRFLYTIPWGLWGKHLTCGILSLWLMSVINCVPLPFVFVLCMVWGTLKEVKSLSASRVGVTGLGDCFLSTNNCLPPPLLCCWWCGSSSMGLPLRDKKPLLNVVKESFLSQWVNPLTCLPSLPSLWGCRNCWSFVCNVLKLKWLKRPGSRWRWEGASYQRCQLPNFKFFFE